MSSRIRSHIQSNVVGYAALFVALSGTAWAANGPLAGTNTVGSSDIINKEVKRRDLALNSVNSARVAPQTLTGADVQNDSLSPLDIADLSVLKGSGIVRIDGGTFANFLRVDDFVLQGQCSGDPATAEVQVFDSGGDPLWTYAVDSTAPGGVDGAPSVGGNATLGRLVSTGTGLFGVGEFALVAKKSGVFHRPVMGTIALGAEVLGEDCVFAASVVG